MQAIKVLLTDDHALVRAGLRSLLDKLDGIEVVAEARDGREAIDLIQAHHPDVVLMDISMAGLNGLETTARIAKAFPHVRVVILSMHTDTAYVSRALQAGATGYVLKDAAFTELELAVRTGAQGKAYISPAVSQHVIDVYTGRIKREDQSATSDLALLDRLTPRHREVLQLIAEGHTTKEIAVILELSIKTVDSHRTELMRRLDLHDIASLVRYAVRTGLVQPEG